MKSTYTEKAPQGEDTPAAEQSKEHAVTDLIYRQDAINAMLALQEGDEAMYGCSIPEGFDGDRAAEVLKHLPSAESDIEKAFRLFVNWADECDFGYDNIHDLYEEYRDDIRVKGLSYIDGLMYIAKMEVERGAYVFKEQGHSAFAPDQDERKAARDIKILDHIPEGWRVVIGAINAPNGYRYINNNKSLFSGEYQSALVPEDIAAEWWINNKEDKQ